MFARTGVRGGLALGGDGQWPPQCEFALKTEGLKRARVWVWLYELTSQRLLDVVQGLSGVGDSALFASRKLVVSASVPVRLPSLIVSCRISVFVGILPISPLW
jgi:hypothetical protein